MIESTLETISNFLQQTAEKYQIYIIIHDFDGFTLNYRDRLSIITGKVCKYCDLLHDNAESLRHCLEKQLDVLKKCADGRPFYGMCYAGVEELVVPIKYQQNVLGYISVNGLRSDFQKAAPRIENVCHQYHLNKKLLFNAYERDLKPKPQNLNEIETDISLAAAALSLLYREMIYFYAVQRQITDKQTLCVQIENYIRLNYMSELNISVLSKFFSCSASTITHTFKKYKGLNIKAFINQVRLEKSCEQLLSSNASVSDIASNIGFNDANYFAKIFKAQYGISPRAFRQKYTKHPPAGN